MSYLFMHWSQLNSVALTTFRIFANLSCHPFLMHPSIHSLALIDALTFDFCTHTSVQSSVFHENRWSALCASLDFVHTLSPFLTTAVLPSTFPHFQRWALFSSNLVSFIEFNVHLFNQLQVRLSISRFIHSGCGPHWYTSNSSICPSTQSFTKPFTYSSTENPSYQSIKPPWQFRGHQHTHYSLRS